MIFCPVSNVNQINRSGTFYAQILKGVECGGECIREWIEMETNFVFKVLQYRVLENILYQDYNLASLRTWHPFGKIWDSGALETGAPFIHSL